MNNVLPFSKISAKDIKEVGGKVSSIGEMYNKLKKQKIRVPGGFCVTSTAFQSFLESNNLRSKILDEMCSNTPSIFTELIRFFNTF